MDHGARCSVDSIGSNVFESVALPIVKYRTTNCYEDARNCTTIEFVRLNLEAYIVHLVFPSVMLRRQINQP